MNPVTVENVAQTSQNPTALMYVVLIFLGIIAMGVIISVVRWIVDIKTGTLPNDIKELKGQVGAMAILQAEINTKLLGRQERVEEIDDRIEIHVGKYHGGQKPTGGGR